GEAKVWRIAPATPVSVGQAAMRGNGERYVTFSSNTFQVWNARVDSPVGAKRTAPGVIVNVLCSATGERLVVQTSDSDNEAKLAHVFDSGEKPANSFSAPGTGRRWWLNESGTKL